MQEKIGRRGGDAGQNQTFLDYVLRTGFDALWLSRLSLPQCGFQSFRNGIGFIQILNGVIPIHTLKETLYPLNLLCERIPFYVISHVYKIPNDSKKHDGANLVKAIASYKKYFAQGSGQYDHTKTSRMVLKDYVNGVLLYCKLPPHLASDVIINQTNVVPDTII